MSFFYDINKKLQQVLESPKSEHKQLNEDKGFPAFAKGRKKYGDGMEELSKAARDGASEKTMDQIRDKHNRYKDKDKMDEASTGDYSAKKAAAGKDIGKPGKQFAKIAKSAGERYGSEERGRKVAGAMLAKLRASGGVKEADMEEGNRFTKGLEDDDIKIGQKIPGTNAIKTKDIDERVEKTARGIVHKAGAGGYGRKFDTDEEGNEKAEKTPAVKRGRGRPKAGSDETGAVKKYDTEPATKAMGFGKATKSKVPGKVVKKADQEPEERTKPAPLPLRSMLTKRPTKYRGSSDIDEGFDDVQDQGEYDQEGDMAKDQLHTLTKAAEELSSILDDDQDLPEWVQSKITKALEFINTSNDYMDQERHDSDMMQVNELSPDTLSSYADKARGQRNWAAGRAMSAQQGHKSADPEGKFDRLWDKRAAGYNKAVAKGATDIDKTQGLQSKGGPASSWNWSKDDSPAALKRDKGMTPVDEADKEMDERKLTKPEMGKREKYVKSMKKSKGDFEKRYGERGEEVMYATATKMAKKKGKKKEEVEETTTAGSVATVSTGGNASKGGMQFGKGIYDNWNRELEQVIAESMNISMNMNSDSHGGPGRSLTVTATDEDAMKLAALLKMAGVGGGDSDCGCGQSPCGCESQMVDENKPDWPTNTETSHDALQYAGGLNKPKTDVAGDGQTTVPNTAVHTQDEDELRRIKEMAGLSEASPNPYPIGQDAMTPQERLNPTNNPNKSVAQGIKDFIKNPTKPAMEETDIAEASKPDYIDLDKDGDKEEPMKSAAKDAEEHNEIKESLLNMNQLWKPYRG